jgi:NADPH:quinone reductase-like Zn-dependent oxidoreductase
MSVAFFQLSVAGCQLPVDNRQPITDNRQLYNMKQVVICSQALKEKMPQNPTIQTIRIDDFPVTVGLIISEDETFDPAKEENKNLVLVKKRAFSCNYRDKALLFDASIRCNSNKGGLSFSPIGSDFVATIIAKGKSVSGFEIGDRVITNDHYPYSLHSEALPGIPSNYASKELDVFHYAKLIKIPDQMSDEIAASFTIGAQTAYSMIRKLEIKSGKNILVTSAKSNTSLFAIAALQYSGANVYAISSSEKFKENLYKLGIKELFVIKPEIKNFLEHKGIEELVKNTGGFDGIIDPFFDLHIGKLIDSMNHFGKYTTCGLYDQYSTLIGKPFRYQGDNLAEIITKALVKNIHIIGNCLGLTEDLQKAIDDHVAGKFQVLIDAVYSEGEETEFFERTYNAKDRFGKVVYRYEN